METGDDEPRYPASFETIAEMSEKSGGSLDGRDRNHSPTAPAGGRRWFWRLLRSAGGVYLLILLLLFLGEPYLVYPVLLFGEPDSAELTADKATHLVDCHIRSQDGNRIHLVHFCPPERPVRKQSVILYCHGNGESLSGLKPFVVSLGQRYGASVVAFDYRGYGNSEGFPHQAGILEDATAAYHYLIDQGYRPSNITIFGRSLGGGPACHLAATQEIGGLVLQNTFSSLVDVAAEKYFWVPVRWMMRNRYPSTQWIGRYSGPLLQTHGTDDTVVPFWQGKKLFDSSASPTGKKRFLVQQGGRHNQPISPEFDRALRKFVHRQLP